MDDGSTEMKRSSEIAKQRGKEGESTAEGDLCPAMVSHVCSCFSELSQSVPA